MAAEPRTALNELGSSLSSLRRARTQLKKALTKGALPAVAVASLWPEYHRLDDAVKTLAWQLRHASEGA